MITCTVLRERIRWTTCCNIRVFTAWLTHQLHGHCSKVAETRSVLLGQSTVWLSPMTMNGEKYSYRWITLFQGYKCEETIVNMEYIREETHELKIYGGKWIHFAELTWRNTEENNYARRHSNISAKQFVQERMRKVVILLVNRMYARLPQ